MKRGNKKRVNKLLKNSDLLSLTKEKPEKLLVQVEELKRTLSKEEKETIDLNIRTVEALLKTYKKWFEMKIRKNNKAKIEHEKQKTIIRLVEQLEGKGMDKIPFMAASKTRGLTYHTYKKSSKETKLEIVKELVEEYIVTGKYDKFKGLFAETFELLLDSTVSRRTGQTGLKKMEAKFEKFNIPKLSSLKTGEKAKNWYVFPEKNKEFFDSYLEKNGIRMRYFKGIHKRPDAMLSINGEIYLIEQKFLKQTGGSQDKQMNEVIKFMKQREPKANKKVHYVSYVQGQRLNDLINKPTGKSKLFLEEIEKSHKRNRNNYFLGTAGFEKLIEQAKKRKNNIKKATI